MGLETDDAVQEFEDNLEELLGSYIDHDLVPHKTIALILRAEAKRFDEMAYEPDEGSTREDDNSEGAEVGSGDE